MAASPHSGREHNPPAGRVGPSRLDLGERHRVSVVLEAGGDGGREDAGDGAERGFVRDAAEVAAEEVQAAAAEGGGRQRGRRVGEGANVDMADRTGGYAGAAAGRGGKERLG